MDSTKLGEHITNFLGGLSQACLVLLVVLIGAACMGLIWLFDYAEARIAAVAVGLLAVTVIVMILYDFILT